MANRRSILGRIRLISYAAAMAALAAVAPASLARAEEPTTQPSVTLPPVVFERETLDNGLRVIYAPLKQAPVVHVRVLYHVGSRDEKPDRQGFAHMFEHMMFRGSAHIAPQEHMKLIGQVGGDSNAFTSFDQTTYVNTIPAPYTEMALYLEADRMSSFKVSDEIFRTERKVVSEEWRMRTANPPYGTLEQDFARTAFKNHSYRWTPIGDMDQLRAASSSELQTFFNRYYVPNNACLIIAGDIDPKQAREWVHKYFGWIPRGGDIVREIAAEPEQTEARSFIRYKRDVPLPAIIMGYKTAVYRDDDHYALGALGDILSGGRASRLERLLVTGDDPKCVQASAGDLQLEDVSSFEITARLLPGADPDEVQSIVADALADVCTKGVTDEELARVKTATLSGLMRSRETCTQLATQLGEEEVFGGDAGRVNQELQKVDALTPADIQRVANKYLRPERLTVVRYIPDPTGVRAHEAMKNATTQPSDAAGAGDEKAKLTSEAPVAQSNEVVPARVTSFPDGYPTEPPMNNQPIRAHYDKGTEATVNGTQVITLTDHRLPIVSCTLVLRHGAYTEPAGKQGLGRMTSQMLRRGSAGIDADTFSRDLESRGIQVEAMDGGDTTRVTVSCLSDQLDYAIDRAKLIIRQPNFNEDEFKKLHFRSMAQLRQMLSQPAMLANRELTAELYGRESVLGRDETPQSVAAITLDDVKQYYAQNYQPDNALIVFAGDVASDKAKDLAGKLMDGWTAAGSAPAISYAAADPATSRRIILIDNPDGQQSSIRIGVRAYDIRSDEKFAGSLATAILSSGIDSRLNRYVRAEKGYTYGCYGRFQPGRHGGAFDVTVDTNPATTGPCIEAVFKVLDDMRNADVTPQELAESKTRATGGMLMDTQTAAQQAVRRSEGILNDYPVDYYDDLPDKYALVTADQIRAVVDKYILPDRMTIIVVGPADKIKSQLTDLGTVEVRPMPIRRSERGGWMGGRGGRNRGSPTTNPADQPTTKPADDLMK